MATAEVSPVIQANVTASLLGTSSAGDLDMCMALAQAPALERWQRPHRRALRFLLGPLARRGGKGGDRSSDRLCGSSDSEAETLALGETEQRAVPDAASTSRTASCDASAAGAAAAAPPQQQQCSEHGVLGRAMRALVGCIVRLTRGVGSQLRPRGPGINDTLMAERVANIITSLPFMALGLMTLRSRKTSAARHFGISFVGVGAAACLYHGCSGRWRPVARKLDYWAICYSTGALRKATHVHLPRAARVASALLTPVAPTVVTFFNLVAIETRYTREVLQHEHLVRAWLWHIATAVVGVGSFAVEDTAIERDWPPVFHAAWHCLSAAAVGTATHELLNHLDA